MRFFKPLKKMFVSNKRACENCQYFRKPGSMDIDIPGNGNWCSNSKSAFYRTRPDANSQCPEFYKAGKKAPLRLRIANKVLATANKQLAKKAQEKKTVTGRRGARA